MVWWCPNYLPFLDELEEHHGVDVQPSVPYSVFCDWSDALRQELGPQQARLFVDRSATACEHGWWCVILYQTDFERLAAHGEHGL